MGEFAGHERRGSLTWPGRSALTGMFGAALGLRRDGDFSALEVLRMAVAVFDAGTVLRDYHTVQTVPSAVARRPQSRPEALRIAGQRTNTTITLRDYRAAPAFGVAVWGGDLEGLASALRRPVFILYLGRKSCPLSAPLNPQIVAADAPETALAQLRLPPWLRDPKAGVIISDDLDGATRRETRHDIATDRRAWHFAPREVGVRAVDIRPGAQA